MEAVQATGGIGEPANNIGFTVSGQGVQAAGNYPIEGLARPAAFLVQGPVISQLVLPAQEGPLADVTARVQWKRIVRNGAAWSVATVPALLRLTLVDGTPETAAAEVTEEATGAVLMAVAQQPIKTGSITITA